MKQPASVKDVKREMRRGIKDLAKAGGIAFDRKALDNHAEAAANNALSGRLELQDNETVYRTHDSEVLTKHRALAVLQAHWPPRTLAQVGRVAYYAAICELLGADVGDIRR